jgi:hypothetical protein
MKDVELREAFLDLVKLIENWYRGPMKSTDYEEQLLRIGKIAEKLVEPDPSPSGFSIQRDEKI